MPCLPFATRLPRALTRALLAAAPCSLICVLCVMYLCIVPSVCVCAAYLGNLLLDERKDVAGAESAYRDAITAYPKFVLAYNNLEYLLNNMIEEF